MSASLGSAPVDPYPTMTDRQKLAVAKAVPYVACKEPVLLGIPEGKWRVKRRPEAEGGNYFCPEQDLPGVSRPHLCNHIRREHLRVCIQCSLCEHRCWAFDTARRHLLRVHRLAEPPTATEVAKVPVSSAAQREVDEAAEAADSLRVAVERGLIPSPLPSPLDPDEGRYQSLVRIPTGSDEESD